MGDRVSIQFVGANDHDKSPVLFSHWDGMTLVKEAKKFVKAIHQEALTAGSMFALHRFEAQTMLVEFIRRYATEQVNSNYYLGCDENSGDNSDNGHHIINTNNARSYNSSNKLDIGILKCEGECETATEHIVLERDDDNIAMRVECNVCDIGRETTFRDCIDEDTRDWLLGK